jgi:predicted negative regulator of RcsB-dependent stress response
VNEYMNEQEQWEMVVKPWLRQNLPWVFVGVALAVGMLGGWRWYQARLDAKGLEAHASYEQILSAYERGNLPEGEKLTDALRAAQPKSGYSVQADLLTASAEIQNKQGAQGIVRLTRVMNDSADPSLQLVARLRLARAQIDLGQSDAALQTLGGDDAGGALAARFAEVRGDALLAKGDRAGALKAYQAARASGAGTVDTDMLDLKINELEQS